MSATKLPQPLGGPAPSEVPLPRAPLDLVLAQVQFTEQAAVATDLGIAEFQKRLKRRYPDYSRDSARQMHVDVLSGAQSIRDLPLHRFSDENKEWRVTLGVNAIGIDTKHYTSREDFLGRLAEVVEAVEVCFDPRLVQRIGVRYIDRIGDPDALTHLDRFLRPEMRGIACSELNPQILHAVTESSMTVEEGNMLLRWGLLPPNSTVDPALIPAVPNRSWLLDIDVSSTERRTFSSGALHSAFAALTARAYAAFRYTVTEDFLKFFGGEPK